MTARAQLQVHRLGWLVAAAVLALASCTSGQAVEPYHHTIHGLAMEGTVPPAASTAPPAAIVDRTSSAVLDESVTPTPVDEVSGTKVPGPSVEAAGGRDIASIVCSYSWPCAEALAVMACESGGNPSARNGPFLGLFQTWEAWYPHFGEDVSAWADPETNVRVAYRIWSETRDWRMWSCKPW